MNSERKESGENFYQSKLIVHQCRSSTQCPSLLGDFGPEKNNSRQPKFVLKLKIKIAANNTLVTPLLAVKFRFTQKGNVLQVQNRVHI